MHTHTWRPTEQEHAVYDLECSECETVAVACPWCEGGCERCDGGVFYEIGKD